ncbi:MAG: hypothetical protein LBC59_09655 [Chitinispirillales bacterium]|jgi:hypothetical protein|nr:hypothetical protein [Chitinispirillales bacterium]
MRKVIAGVGDRIGDRHDVDVGCELGGREGVIKAKSGISLMVLAVVLLFGSSLVGCSGTLGTFTVISTKNVDWSRASEFNRNNQRVKGKDVYHIIVFVPTKLNVTVSEALDNALLQIPGAIAMVDATVKVSTFYIPYIYGRSGYSIEGSVLVDPKLALFYEGSSSHLVLYTEDGKNFKKRSVSEAEYLTYIK